MEGDRPIQGTGSDSTEKHQNVPPHIEENHEDDECSFEISSIRLSEDQDSSPMDDEEDIPDSPKAPPASPFRTRWVRGMKDPNTSFGSPNIQSPITQYKPASKQHIASHFAKEFTESELVKDFQNVDRSALDASAVTNSLLESSFTGPDSTNARLEAAYMWTKRENNSLLKKIKDLEEDAAAREQAKLEGMISGINSSSPMKWVKSMLAQTPDSESPKESMDKGDESQLKPKQDALKRFPTQLYPSELESLALPTLSPTTINTEPRTDESTHFEETTNAYSEKETRPSSYRKMMLLFLLALVFAMLSAHREKVQFAAKGVKSNVATILKEHEELLNSITKSVSETKDVVDARLQPAKDFIMPHLASAITICQNNYEHYFQVAVEEFKNLQLKLGLKLDWESDILPMAHRYAGRQGEVPLEGMNVVVVTASTAVGSELTDVFSRLGARVIAVDASYRYLASVKATAPLVDTLKVDFADLVSVAKGADDIAESFSHVDVLINCVNDYSREYGRTEQGYDKYFGGNYLSEFLLTTKLLEQLNRSPRGTLVQLQSMAHMTVNGSDLRVDEATNQPFASVPGELNSILAYSNSLLASSMHSQYLSQTQKGVRVMRITSTPFIPAMSARAVLASVLGEADASPTESLHSSLKLAKQKLGVFKDQFINPGEFADPLKDEELLHNLMEWSEEEVSPYWWTKIEVAPKTANIVQETTSWVSDHDYDGEASEYNAFYASSIATLVSVGSLSLLRQLMPSRYGGA
ncbi:unnamed protein product [Cylindrotheca closterium]|uniref:Uncharacterized protein n=1 Tax=Cylindrotheca closterium TaxID=2856 RepID=A0AAD2G4A7_9STRA|nr:unnamed protein product [Cylindrotheca closterium]